MGSQQEYTSILSLPGFRVVGITWEDDGGDTRLRIQIERRGIRWYPCGGCGRRTGAR